VTGLQLTVTREDETYSDSKAANGQSEIRRVEGEQDAALEAAEAVPSCEQYAECGCGKEGSWKMQVACGGVDRERLDESDHAGVEGDEMDDGAEDVREGDVSTTAPCRQGDAGELLCFDTRRDGGIAEQRRGDTELRDGLADALSEKLAAERENAEPGDEQEEEARAAASFRRLCRKEGVAGAG
jgi:hypothetical protein